MTLAKTNEQTWIRALTTPRVFPREPPIGPVYQETASWQKFSGVFDRAYDDLAHYQNESEAMDVGSAVIDEIFITWCPLVEAEPGVLYIVRVVAAGFRRVRIPGLPGTVFGP